MEELNNLEQPEVTGSNEMIGKFKDAESLLKAYNNLEAEFTKKSQKLAILETESKQNAELKEKIAENERKVDEFVTKYEMMRPFSNVLKESLSNENAVLEEEAVKILTQNYKSAENYASDEEFLNKYIYSNQGIRERIVKDYLSKITQNSPIKAESSLSSITLTPPSVPTTISEAGKLAKSIIKQK